MKIAWISELGYVGQIPKEEPNQRVDIVWQIMLESHHFNWQIVLQQPEILKNFDIVIAVLPKKQPQLIQIILDEHLHTKYNFIIMQEGPCTLWEDWKTEDQINYIQVLKECKGVLVHGASDRKFYEGILGRKCYIMPTVVHKEFFDRIPKLPQKPGSLIIGGNACSWYNGQGSISTAQNNPKITKVFLPSMGRKIEHEDILMSMLSGKDIHYFPYVIWKDFITLMSQAQYAVHLMPAAAAGTFNLNCAMLGIPCIGNKLTDTQKECFPDLSIDVTDIQKATELLEKLTNDESFYEEVAIKALKSSERFYVENKKEEIFQILKELLNDT